ncbi:MAG: hypothetical protein M3279_08155 [Actinomycetota bacterium]|nr:hypothetical protein [Actinomycetota bacterium]
MSDPTTEGARSFPAPVRLDGYFAWTWRSFRACFARLGPVFAGGVVAASLLDYGVILFMVEVLDVRPTLEVRALAFAAEVLLLTIAGTLLAAVAAPVFLADIAGHRAGSDTGGRRLRPMLGHVIVSALYLAMPLLLLVLFLGGIMRVLLLPAVLGPPVLVHAIVWERLEFRDAATRAKNLLSGHWGRVLSALLVLAVGPALIQIVGLTTLSLVLPDLDDAGFVGSLWATIIVALATAPVWLFTSAAGTVAYADLRARAEELDRETLRAEAAALPAAP